MSENAMWQALRPAFVRTGLHPVRIESHYTDQGIPDVNYRDGWVELKHVDDWPARGGPLKIKHFTKEQRSWLRQREACGGFAFLLLRVGQEWLLFRGTVAALSIGAATREQLYGVALARWVGRTPRPLELKRWLSRT